MKQILLFSVLLLLLAAPVSATYTNIFPASDTVIVNQSYTHDPTGGTAVPWTLWVASGLIGLILIVISLCRSKTQKMDYEINIIISLLSWPFCWYFTYGGLTTVDYIVGTGAAANANLTSMITQHILYSFWVLGCIGVAGSLFAVFVTILLAAQYRLFQDNEAAAAAERQTARNQEE